MVWLNVAFCSRNIPNYFKQSADESLIAIEGSGRSFHGAIDTSVSVKITSDKMMKQWGWNDFFRRERYCGRLIIQYTLFD